MKKILSVVLIQFLSFYTFSQDSLSKEDLAPYVYSFQIEDGKIVGDGADFLKEEVAKSQFTLLGEMHFEASIADFTNALIPILNACNYDHLVLEVGPEMGAILNELEGDVVKGIRDINAKYLMSDDEESWGPIPFFESVEDARFLQTAKDNKWSILGIDQEYSDSFIFLMDEMFDNLSQRRKTKHRQIYKEARDSLQFYYEREEQGGMPYIVSITNSKKIEDFLEAVSCNTENEPIATAIRISVDIYKYNYDKQWFTNYGIRIAYMKEQLKLGLQKSDFDLSKDKLLIKMGALHLSKGTSPYNYIEVGNTLHEIAEFNGKSALGIHFATRYQLEDGKLVDEMDNQSPRDKAYNGFTQMGKPDEWVIIDMRPLRKEVHWYPKPLKKKMTKELEDMIGWYDLLVIAPAYPELTPNH